MLGLDVCDNEVAIAQHFGVVNINRPAVRAAPGDDGSGIACGHALQDGTLVQGHRNVLRPGDDARPLGKLGAGSYRKGEEDDVLVHVTDSISALSLHLLKKIGF